MARNNCQQEEAYTQGNDNEARMANSADEARSLRMAGNISSNINGNSRAGDIAGDKRMSLLHAQGEPRLGRREDDPEPEAPWYRRREFFIGTFLGLVVVIGVMVLLIVLANFTK